MNIHNSLFRFFLILLLSLNCFSGQAENANVRMMVHLLDYISADYSMAVQNGTVINEGEYGEMNEFINTVENMGASAPKKIQLEIAELKGLITEAAAVKEVSSKASFIKNSLVEHFRLTTAPKNWPSITKGKQLYDKNCQSCHGVKGMGDGLLSKGLNPQPTNFHSPDKANGISPFQAYNTIRLGVNNTAMRAFNELNDEDTWDLAFYVLSLPHQNQNIQSTIVQDKIQGEITLQALASQNNKELTSNLKLDPDYPSLISALRLFPKDLAEKSQSDYLSKAEKLIRLSDEAYQQGNKDKARQLALSAYLDGIEPIEVKLSANDASFVGKLEGQLSKMRGAIENELDVPIVSEEARASLLLIQQARDVLEAKTFSSGLTFALSSTIILREGLEAFLVIITILGIIRALKLKGAASWIHGGWIAAIASGILMWWAANSLFTFSGAQREIMEGAIALFAVVILLYVGFWMHSKSEAGKWQAYVKNKIQKLASKENMIGLSVLSFIVVFREAFESVLFLSALSVEAGESHQLAFGGGIISAFIVLAILSVLLLRFSKKLPITQLFKYSAIIIAILAVVLAGKGIHALQEAGTIGISNTPFNLRIDLLGVYPTWQSLASQLLIITVIIFLWKIGNRSIASKPAHT